MVRSQRAWHGGIRVQSGQFLWWRNILKPKRDNHKIQRVGWLSPTFLFSSTLNRKRRWPSLSHKAKRVISLPTSRSSSRIFLSRAIIASQKIYLFFWVNSIWTVSIHPEGPLKVWPSGSGDPLRIDLVNRIDGWDWKRGGGDEYVHSTPNDLRRGVKVFSLLTLPRLTLWRSLLERTHVSKHANEPCGSHVDSNTFLTQVISMTSNSSLLTPIVHV